MNENQFEQLVAQMLSGVQSSTSWTLETQRREIEAQDQRLYAAENVLIKALSFVKAERARLRTQQNQEPLRELHDKLVGQGQGPVRELPQAKQKQPF